jgi:hypothetical protein
METTKAKSAAELVAEFTDLVERLYELEGSSLYTTDVVTCFIRPKEYYAIHALKARIKALEKAKADNDERERLKGIVRDILKESKIRLGNDGYNHIELIGQFEPTRTIPGDPNP